MEENNEMNILTEILESKRTDSATGIYSCCSSNPYVIEAALLRAKQSGTKCVIEATANQVDQYGGYTGMKPVEFAWMVENMANNIGLDSDQLVLGGDHLGPLTWSHLPEEQAMSEAKELIRQYVLAGFKKIHLDTSMRLASDDPNKPLAVTLVAKRAADLCQVAEFTFEEIKQQSKTALKPLFYVIGSEVPIPGGSHGNEDALQVTLPADAHQAIESFRAAFLEHNLLDAWSRVHALVVQPGVEFGDSEVHYYDHDKAEDLCHVLDDYPDFVFEGHSTDYQTREGLRQMVKDGIAILKVGPALTFALREGLYALESIEKELIADQAKLSHFRTTLDHEMVQNPRYWEKHYDGSEEDRRFKRAFSQSDRSRYYMTNIEVVASIEKLLNNIDASKIPLALLSQYLPIQYIAVKEKRLENSAHSIIIDVVGQVIDDYLEALKSNTSESGC